MLGIRAILGCFFPECLIGDALGIFPSFDKALMIILEDNESEHGTLLEFLGLSVGCRIDESPILASLSLPQERIQNLVEII